MQRLEIKMQNSRKTTRVYVPLLSTFVMIAKPEIAKVSILKRFSLSCLKFQRINQDKKQSYFAGTAAENEDNC